MEEKKNVEKALEEDIKTEKNYKVYFVLLIFMLLAFLVIGGAFYSKISKADLSSLKHDVMLPQDEEIVTDDKNVDSSNLIFENGSQWDGKSPLGGKVSEATQDQIRIEGYTNLYLYDDKREVDLINAKDNPVYLKYVIKDEFDKTLIETDLIAPNTMVSKDLYSLLSTGEHQLKFIISTYDINDYSECCGTTLSVKVTVE